MSMMMMMMMMMMSSREIAVALSGSFCDELRVTSTASMSFLDAQSQTAVFVSVKDSHLG